MRAVLFDMDGVLVRSEEVWFRVVAAAGERFRGRAITRDEFFPTFGQGTAADIPVFGLRCTVEALDAFYVEHFRHHLDAMWVNPEAKPLLEQVRRRGLSTAVVTNTVAPLTGSILERAGLSALLPVRATADRVAHAKPAPDLVALALKELGVGPADAVLIGDSRFDREAAQAAGVRFVGLKLDGDGRVERLGDVPVELGWEQRWRLRPAHPGELEAVRAFVSQRGLPVAGLEAQFPGAFVVAVDGGRLVGVAALELHDGHGLLRSVAVAPSLTGLGLGSALVDERLAEARKRGLSSVSLLTTTAERWFSARGFHRAPREQAAPPIASTLEFTGACPDSAAHLLWRP